MLVFFGTHVDATVKDLLFTLLGVLTDQVGHGHWVLFWFQCRFIAEDSGDQRRLVASPQPVKGLLETTHGGLQCMRRAVWISAPEAEPAGAISKCAGTSAAYEERDHTPIQRLDNSCALQLACVPPRPSRHLERAQ